MNFIAHPSPTRLCRLFSGFLFFTCLYIATSCHRDEFSPKMPQPQNGIGIFHAHLDGEEGNGNARAEWLKMSHQAAPGVDWQKMDAATREKLYRMKLDRFGSGNAESAPMIESFANSQIQGTWAERGSLNQAGNLRTVDYEADQDYIYGIGDGGAIYRRQLVGNAGWSLLHDDHQFDSKILSVIPNGSGGKRILTSIGMQVWYSDDLGATWAQSGGLTGNWYDWGAMQILPVNEGANGVYFLAFTWDWTPWDTRAKLFYSSNRGQTFSLVRTFAHNGVYYEANRYTKIWAKPGATTAYAFHTSTGGGMYQLNGSSVTLLHPQVTIPANAFIDLDGFVSGSKKIHWLLQYPNTLYKSGNEGLTWTNMGTLPANPWDVGIFASPIDSNNLFFGEVDCYRSFNQGASWDDVNIWWQYYGNIDFLHADIMDLKAFTTTGGTDFILIANHGGLHVSYDSLQTTENLSETGLTISQYYDVRTDPSDANYFYAGTQDQGHQRSAFATGSNIVNFEQVISGDYGHMAFSNNGSSLWTVYPGGWVTYYYNPRTAGHNSDYQITGDNKPVSGWINPTAETPDPADHSIYIAGGNINGGAGSHLVKLTALPIFPHTITATQFAYDFHANSGGGTISAIAASSVNTSKLFVATSNGKFFYSNNGGLTWTQSPSFTGPPEFYVYGSCILPSADDPNLVWFCGSGYSNPPVYKSTNGGQTFTAMSNGLPNTLVQAIVANPAETAIYAATEVGPYVYIVADDEWYPMIGATTPIQRYYSIEYVSPGDILRFGTFGRGAWQFTITSQPGDCAADLYLAQDPIPAGTYSAGTAIHVTGRVASGSNVILSAPTVNMNPQATVDLGGTVTTDTAGCENN